MPFSTTHSDLTPAEAADRRDAEGQMALLATREGRPHVATHPNHREEADTCGGANTGMLRQPSYPLGLGDRGWMCLASPG